MLCVVFGDFGVRIELLEFKDLGLRLPVGITKAWGSSKGSAGMLSVFEGVHLRKFKDRVEVLHVLRQFCLVTGPHPVCTDDW